MISELKSDRPFPNCWKTTASCNLQTFPNHSHPGTYARCTFAQTQPKTTQTTAQLSIIFPTNWKLRKCFLPLLADFSEDFFCRSQKKHQLSPYSGGLLIFFVLIYTQPGSFTHSPSQVSQSGKHWICRFHVYNN